MSIFKNSMRAAVVLLCLLSLALGARAQYRASLQGSVLDAQGEAVSGAKVTVTAKDTGLSQETTTDDNGVYAINRLGPGRYTVTAEQKGFQKKIITDLTIQGEQANSLNIALEVGQLAQEITVNGDDLPDLNTESGAITGNITARELENLPSLGRDPFQLLRLAPGVFGDGAAGSGGGGQQLPGQNQVGSNASSSVFMTENQPGIVAGGSRNNGNNYQVDGIEVNSLTWGGSSLITPNEESVKEVEIQANPYNAEYGRGSGAQVLVVSQSGTNQIHGSLFFKAHRPGLDAYQRAGGPNGQPGTRDNGRFNQYGGSVGGPVIKNRLFLFFSYETQRDNSIGNASGWYVTPQFYTAAAAANPTSIAATWANFPGVNASVASINTSVNNCANAGFIEYNPVTKVGNCQTLPGGLDIGSPLKTALGTFDPSYGSAAAPFGIGGGLDGIPDVFNVITNNPTQSTAIQYNGRADFQVTHNDLLTFSVYWVPNDNTSYNGPVRPVNLWHSNRLNYSGALAWNHTFSPTLINEARVNVVRWYFDEEKSNPQMAFGFPVGNVDNLGNVGLVGPAFGPPGPGIFYQTAYNFRDTLTKVYNSHSIKFGADIYKDQVQDTAVWAGLPPSYQFNNLWDWANDAPYRESGAFDPRTGTPTGVKKYIRSNVNAVFIQDDYKIRPNFTVNIGLRWEYFGPLHEKYGNLGVVTLGQGDASLTDIKVQTGVNLYESSYNNWGPQIGFAWSPKGVLGHEFNNRFVIRGGGGISYNRQMEAITLNGRLNPPVVIQLGNLQSSTGQVFYAPSDSTSNLFGFPANPAAVETFGPNGLPTCAPVNCAAVNLTAFDHSIPTPYVYRYSLLAQYDVGHHWIATVGYQGSQSRHFFRQINNVNWLYPDNRNPAVAGVDYYTNDANANYNGIYFEAHHQFAQTFEVDATYTYSKCNDHGSQDYYGDPYPFDIKASAGPCDYDVTHSFKAYGVWSPRIFHGVNDWREKILGGWQISGIFTWHTGFPWTPTYNVQYAYAGDGNTCSLIYQDSGYCQAEPAAYLGGAGHSTANSTFLKNYGNFPALANADQATGTNAYFAVPTFSANGMPSFPGVHRNAFRGPHYRDFDFTLGKDFGLPHAKIIGENAKLAFRANFYNLFNSLNLAPLSGDQSLGTLQVDQATGQITNFNPNPGFGIANNALGARVIELQARFSF